MESSTIFVGREELSEDGEYDVISNPEPRSVESSIADLGAFPPAVNVRTNVVEPTPTRAAREKFPTANFTVDEIQAYVRKTAISAAAHLNDQGTVRGPPEQKATRVYVDGTFDAFNVAHALQLRQAKLSFPSVHLIVGVFQDTLFGEDATSLPQVERCELVRHCRWVDEVIEDAPPTLDEQFLRQRRIDYVAVDEGSSVDPFCSKERLKGYDYLKEIGKVIVTRRTTGVVQALTVRPNPDPFGTPRSPSLEPPLETPAGAAHMDIYGIGI